MLEREGHFEWIALWNQVRGTKWGLVVDMRGSDLSGKLRRERRAVRGKTPAGLHAVEAAAAVLKLEPEETPGPRLFFSDKTLAEAKALFPATGGDGTDPGGRARRGMDGQALAGRTLRQGGDQTAGRRRAAGRRAADDRGRGGGPRGGPHHPLRRAARAGDRTAGETDAAADGGGDFASGALYRGGFDLDASGRGGGRADPRGLRPLGRDDARAVEGSGRARTPQLSGVQDPGPPPEPGHPAHDGPAVGTGAEDRDADAGDAGVS